MAKRTRKHRKGILGLGLDSDGQTRITKGDNFMLYGGSKETHERMQETAVKFEEALDKQGKVVDELSPEEFTDIMEKARGK